LDRECGLASEDDTTLTQELGNLSILGAGFMRITFSEYVNISIIWLMFSEPGEISGSHGSEYKMSALWDIASTMW
jgi:hypothetical protein